MDRNLTIAIAVIALISLVTIFYVVPAVSQPTSGMTIVLYDESGNAVYQQSTSPSLVSFYFTNSDGAAISTAVVTVTWSVSGLSTTTAVVIASSESVDCKVMNAVVKTTIPTTPWSDDEQSGSHTTTWNIADLVKREQEGDDLGYDLVFKCTLSATATVDGTQKTVDLPLSISLSVKWVETTFTIEGSMTFA